MLAMPHRIYSHIVASNVGVGYKKARGHWLDCIVFIDIFCGSSNVRNGYKTGMLKLGD